MLERPERPVLPLLAGVAVVCVLIGLGYAAYELYIYRILAVFAGPYIRARGEALAIAGSAAAYLAAIALYAGGSGRASAGDRPASGRLVRVSVAVACGYALLSILVEPRVVREYQTIRRKSGEAAQHIRLAEEARLQKDWGTVRAHLEAYLAIDPADDARRRAVDEAASQVAALSAAAQARPAQAAPTPAATARKPQEPTAESLVAKAREYAGRGDYATALTLAERAQAIDPAGREAEAVRRQAHEGLAAVGPAAAERARADLYGIKEQGDAALRAGDPVRAYYIFERGSRTYPQDAELRDMRASAEAALSRFAFFRDTVPEAGQAPPRDRVERVAFVNRREAGLAEIVYADSVVRVPRTVTATRVEKDGSRNSYRREVVEVYLYGLEALAFGGGSVVYHMRAPVGMLRAAPEPAPQPTRAVDRLLPRAAVQAPAAWISLLALHRSVEADRLTPSFVAGTERRLAEFGGAAKAAPAQANVLPLMVPVGTLWALGLDVGSVRERNVVELWTLSQVIPDVSVRVELALRAVRPFMLILLGALVASASRRHAPVAAFSTGTWLLTPVVAAAGHLVFLLSLHAARVAVVVLADRLGWQAGLTALAAGLLGLLILALLRMDRSLRRAA